MKVFVFRASGSIAQNVVTGLTEKGVEVYAGTRKPSEKKVTPGKLLTISNHKEFL